MKKFLFVLIFSFIAVHSAHAQLVVTEISWRVYNQLYTGLLAIYPGDTGFFVVKFFNPQIGLVRVQQDASLTKKMDIYGNTTFYINCYNPVAYPYVPYSADNFIMYPNGQIYTQDASGTWSTIVTQNVIKEEHWSIKLAEYGLK